MSKGKKVIGTGGQVFRGRGARMAVCCLPLCRRHWPCLLYAQAGRPQIRADQAAVRADRHTTHGHHPCVLAESQNRMPFFSASPTRCASALRRRGRVLHCRCASPPHHLLCSFPALQSLPLPAAGDIAALEYKILLPGARGWMTNMCVTGRFAGRLLLF
jgi:hypothetical protein